MFPKTPYGTLRRFLWKFIFEVFSEVFYQTRIFENPKNLRSIYKRRDFQDFLQRKTDQNIVGLQLKYSI